MENNNQYHDLLTKYLTNEANTEERKFIEGWIDEATENRRYFEHLKDVWQLSSMKRTLDYALDEMDVQEEWDRFKHAIVENEARKQAPVEGEYMQGESSGKKSMVYKYLVRTAIAASVVLVFGIGWKLFVEDKPDTHVVQNSNKQTVNKNFIVRDEINTTGKEKRIQLSDGSLVVLADKSEIVYREPFTSNRDIALIGKAYFKVAKDKTKPFTVTSSDVSTTALGTGFTVTAFEKGKMIIVRLYEGKVVIKAERKTINDVYLLPGQEFIYNRQPVTKLKTFKLKGPAAPEQILNEERLQDDPAVPEDEAGTWYMFNNQQLGQVLDQFADLYNVKIIYDKRDIQNIYFTGQYNKLESLEVILKRIGTLNNLTIAKKENAFIISK